jgi:diapolycopene oxygenase
VGGLASAIRLAVKGYAVDVYEAASIPGGKLGELRIAGFRFDTGPSLFTLPALVEDLFRLCGEDPADHFRYHRLDLITRYFYEDGTVLNAWQDIGRFADEIGSKTTDSPEALHRFLRYSARIYALTHQTFLFRSLHRVDTWLTRDVARALLHLPRLDLFRTMHRAITAHFSDPRLVQLFDRYATYNGSNPFAAPATLNVVPHLEHSIGAFFPEEGMYSIARSLVALAKRQGVHFHFNSPVESIVHANGRVKGLQIGGQELPFDIVVSDVDVHRVYSKLMPDVKRPSLYLDRPKSSSALIFYWGMDHSFPQLDLHNIFFTRDYRQEFHELFEEQQLNSDPTVYVFISSKAVPGDAPAGKENWFVMINAPTDNGQDWPTLIPKQREIIIQKLERILGIPIAMHITCEQVLDPTGIESGTGSHQGALYGNSSNGRLAAFLRHPNSSRKVRGLYFTGGSVHPGGGIPLCLASAAIVDGMVKK